MSEIYIALLLPKLFLLCSLVSAKVGFTVFSRAGWQDQNSLDFVMAAAAWAGHPAEKTAPGKGAQSSSCSWRKHLHQPQDLPVGHHTALEEIFKKLWDFRVQGLHHVEVRYCSYCGEAQHLVWANWKQFTPFLRKISLQPDLKHPVQCPPSVSGC